MSNKWIELMSELHYFLATPKDASFKIKYRKRFKPAKKLCTFQENCRNRLIVEYCVHTIGFYGSKYKCMTPYGIK